MAILHYLKDFEEKKAKKSLDMLLIDRRNEFRELANAMGIPSSSNDWEEIILKFCIDFSDIFKKVLIDTKGPNDHNSDDHTLIHQCVSLMHQIARGKSSMIEITHLQNIAYTLAQEFYTIYKRIA